MSDTNLLEVSEKGIPRRRSTSFLRQMGSKDIRIDFDTRRDIRLDILNQERQEFAAEEGHHSASPSSPPSARPQTRPFTAIDGFDWLKSRFMREGKRQIGVLESLKAIATSSCEYLFVYNIAAKLKIICRVKSFLHLHSNFMGLPLYEPPECRRA